MIHKIKALYDEGRGLSIRAIGKELGVSRNTVRKYLRTEESVVAAAQTDRRRSQRLDGQRAYIVHLLERFPKLSCVKLARKLEAKLGPLAISQRTLRRYVRRVKARVACAQPRYYEPVLDMVPGVQCQVDPGELRRVVIGGEERPVYFVVFVLSFSRVLYVGVSFQPIDTECFIRLHDEAFRYFGGVPEECVYDQTKLVVIAEEFRELTVNPRFHEYATAAGIRVHACEGYDPESKGKVEAGVKYVKQDAFYGDTFADVQALREHLQQWLEDVANARVHGTTGRVPREHFEAEERAHLRSYLTPACARRAGDGLEPRKVDKTGLISWRANKYTVPLAYQQGRVGVREQDAELWIHDLETGTRLAVHPLAPGKGQVVRNTDHYRDHARHLQDLEQAIVGQLGDDLGPRLCARLKATSPRIYKDQLYGVNQLLEAAQPVDTDLIGHLVEREQLTASRLKAYLQATERATERGRDAAEPAPLKRAPDPARLSVYASLVHPSGQPEVTHESA
ncbi:MAG: IS21 family transposase [Pseudomonadota bacterium]